MGFVARIALLVAVMWGAVEYYMGGTGLTTAALSYVGWVEPEPQVERVGLSTGPGEHLAEIYDESYRRTEEAVNKDVNPRRQGPRRAQ